MAIRDYKSQSVKDLYKTLIRPETLTKVVVDSTEKRSRAELLSMVETLFETKKSHVTAEKIRAFLHILIKSIPNETDTDPVSHPNMIDGNTSANLPTRLPISRGKFWVDKGTLKLTS